MKTCPRCGETKPHGEFYRSSRSADGCQSCCKPCQRAVNKASYEAHKEEWKPTRKAWMAANYDRWSAYAKDWFAENRERLDARPRSPESIARARERQRSWRISNPERRRETERRYRVSHPESGRNKAARRASHIGDQKVTAEQIREVLDYFCGCCAYCLKPMSKPTIDHVIPLARGGEHAADNLVAACGSCNSIKSARPVWVMLCQH